MKASKIKVSQELIIKALHMPLDTKILDAKADHFNGVIELVVEHFDLRDLAEGESAPLLMPIIKHIAEEYKWDWNQK
jgi:hypothetical protein